jgi:hypothetical protein
MSTEPRTWPATLWRGTPSPISQPDQDLSTVVRLRVGVGVIGILLPIVLPLGNLLFAEARGLPTAGWWPESMSGSYYTSTRNLFVGGLCALGVFLIGYRYSRREDLFSTVAGVSAIGVALCPTSPLGPTVFQREIGWLHYVFAGVLLVALAMFCLVSFRDQTNSPDPRAKRLYYWAGVTILIAVALALVLGLAHVGARALITPVYLAEWVSVWAFGAAWLYAALDLHRNPPVGR